VPGRVGNVAFVAQAAQPLHFGADGLVNQSALLRSDNSDRRDLLSNTAAPALRTFRRAFVVNRNRHLQIKLLSAFLASIRIGWHGVIVLSFDSRE